MKPSKEQALRIDMVVAVGTDDDGGHTRVTTGDHFLLYGGSEQTHGKMQEKMQRLTELLDERGQDLKTLHPDEFKTMAREIGLID